VHYQHFYARITQGYNALHCVSVWIDGNQQLTATMIRCNATSTETKSLSTAVAAEVHVSRRVLCSRVQHQHQAQELYWQHRTNMWLSHELPMPSTANNHKQ